MCGSLLREDGISCLSPSEPLYGRSSQEAERPVRSAGSARGNPLNDADWSDAGNTRRHFPFNRMDYAGTYRGHFLFSRCLSSAVQIRGIPGTALHDGMLPWPYIAIGEMTSSLIRSEFPGLVTVTGVIAPSAPCPSCAFAGDELVPLKEHFIYDPSLGPVKLSRKSRLNLRKGSRFWHPADANSEEGWRAFVSLSRAFVRDRKITGGFYDFGDEHFHLLSRLGDILVFGVRNPSAWGAIACGARHGTELHLMHIRISALGYKSCASYVLMEEMTRYCTSNRLSLFMGGLRHGADEGLLRFKRRWTNKTLPAWLLRVVIRPDVYRLLAIPGNPFFPAYRSYSP